MPTSSEASRIKAKLMTLLVINIMQPVLRSTLNIQLSKYANPIELLKIINELVNENKIVKEHYRYRTTASGWKSTIPGEGRVLRDIHRMEYLVESSKQRGGFK